MDGYLAGIGLCIQIIGTVLIFSAITCKDEFVLYYNMCYNKTQDEYENKIPISKNPDINMLHIMTGVGFMLSGLCIILISFFKNNKTSGLDKEADTDAEVELIYSPILEWQNTKRDRVYNFEFWKSEIKIIREDNLKEVNKLLRQLEELCKRRGRPMNHRFHL